MGLITFGLVMLFAAPIGGYAYYVAGYIPKRGRAMQVRAWQPLAARLGGTFVASGAGARFHTLSIPFGSTFVTVIVFDRAVYDRELRLWRRDVGGWRTFVQANVNGGRGLGAEIIPKRAGKRSGIPMGDPAFADHYHVESLLATPPELIAARLTPSALAAFAALWPKYESLVVGPSFVGLEIPGICADANLLEAAVYVVGTFAQPVTWNAAVA